MGQVPLPARDPLVRACAAVGSNAIFKSIRVIRDRVLETISRHAMFAPEQKVGVAVSGGADSVCLIHLLHEIAPRWNLRLSVVHIDHGIRGAASRADAEFVSDLARSLALAFHVHRADVLAMNDNLEQAARSVRLSFFGELKSSGVVDSIATGHTRSDQAETVLYRILRGTGITGLAAIRPVTQEGMVRPLLYCTRDEVRAWLEKRGIAWREDETNQNPAFVRNRIRAELLPQLRRDYNPQIDEALANLAELALEEDHSRQVVRQTIEKVKGNLRQIEFGHVEAILKLAVAPKGEGRLQVPGVDVTRSFEYVRFAPARTNAAPRDFALPVTPPETVEIPDQGGQLGFQLIDSPGDPASLNPCDNLVSDLDWQKITTSATIPGQSVLELRNWRAGDAYRTIGQTHPRKIKHLFQEARIPLWERRGWPILTANGQIVWCRRFGVAAAFAAEPSSRTVLRIRDIKS